MASLPPNCANYNSLIVVEGRLYAVGGYDEEVAFSFHEDSDSDDWDQNRQNMDPREAQILAAIQRRYSTTPHLMRNQSNQEHFQYYSASRNVWKALSPMEKGRYNCLLVALDGFIYAIGGSSGHGDAKSYVERYSIADRRWEILPSLPEDHRWVSSVVFHGRILVLGRLCTGRSENMHNPEVIRKYILQVFNPDSKTWRMGLEEQYTVNRSVSMIGWNRRCVRKPLLFVHSDVCYRVLYLIPTELPDEEIRWDWKTQGKPSVQALEWSSDDNGNVTISYGEEIQQDLIGVNDLGAFRIDNEVFVNEKGFIYCTGIEIKPGQVEEVSLNGWKYFDPKLQRHSNAVFFDFDKKKIAH